jgi:ATP-dependent helicase YprA (DUF1998 family)
MSTWQQRGAPAYAGATRWWYMVASQNPLDQYYDNHPLEFFGAPRTAVGI